MADVHRISGMNNCRPGPRLAMRNSRTKRWESYELVEAVRDYLPGALANAAYYKWRK